VKGDHFLTSRRPRSGAHSVEPWLKNCLLKNVITSLWMWGGPPSGSANTSKPHQPEGSHTNGKCINFTDCTAKCSPRNRTSSWCVCVCVVQQIQQILHFNGQRLRAIWHCLQNGVLLIFVWPYACYCGPGNSVGIVTDYGLDGPGSKPGANEIFHPSRPALGPIQPPVQWVTGLSRG